MPKIRDLVEVEIDTTKTRDLYRYLQRYASAILVHEDYDTYHEVKLPLDEDEFVKRVLEIVKN